MAKVKVDADLLRSIPLFSGVSDANVQELALSAFRREVAARTVLFNEGARPADLYTLLRGTVELYSEHQERSYTSGIVRAGGSFILPSVLADRNPLSARTLEPSELLAVPVKLISALFADDPGFADAVIHELASECQEIIEEFKSHRMRSTTERVAHWMLSCDRSTGDTGRIVIPFDKRVLASYLGMAPEHLSRSFSALGAAGVEVHGRCITLNNRAALAVAAGLSEPD